MWSIRPLLYGLVAAYALFAIHLFKTWSFTPPPQYFSASPPNDRYSIMKDVCISKTRGFFALGTEPTEGLLPVNMRANPTSEMTGYFPPYLKPQMAFRDHKALWVNRTLLFGMGYSPEHLTHFFTNNVFPAYSMLRRFRSEGQVDFYSPFLEAIEGAGPIHIWGFNETIVGLEWYKHPVFDDHHIICYPRGILGYNSTCPFTYCAHMHEKVVYDEITERVWKYCRLGPFDDAHDFPGDDQQGRRIHVIQRRTTRRVFKLELLEELLGKFGEVKVFEFEEMAFCDQARIFFEADVAVAVHGNALGHLLWMRPGTRILELSSLGWYSPFFKSLAKQRQADLNYRIFQCNTTACAVPNYSGPTKKRDLVMDEPMLREIEGHLQEVFPVVPLFYFKKEGRNIED